MTPRFLRQSPTRPSAIRGWVENVKKVMTILSSIDNLGIGSGVCFLRDLELNNFSTLNLHSKLNPPCVLILLKISNLLPFSKSRCHCRCHNPHRRHHNNHHLQYHPNLYHRPTPRVPLAPPA